MAETIRKQLQGVREEGFNYLTLAPFIWLCDTLETLLDEREDNSPKEAPMADESELVQEVRAYWATRTKADDAQEAALVATNAAWDANARLRETVKDLPDEKGCVKIGKACFVLSFDVAGYLTVIQHSLLGVADDSPGTGDDHSPDAGEKAEPRETEEIIEIDGDGNVVSLGAQPVEP